MKKLLAFTLAAASLIAVALSQSPTPAPIVIPTPTTTTLTNPIDVQLSAQQVVGFVGYLASQGTTLPPGVTSIYFRINPDGTAVATLRFQ
jgi:hypothetical protein